jgi:hypothetical protein
MTLTIELTPEEAARLRRLARRAGQDETAYLHTLIASLPEETGASLISAEGAMTGAQILEYWDREDVRGIFDPDVDSVELAGQLRRQAETRSSGGERL